LDRLLEAHKRESKVEEAKRLLDNLIVFKLIAEDIRALLSLQLLTSTRSQALMSFRQ